MENIKFYEIDDKYINFLIPYAPLLYHNSKKEQKNTRKYIGILFKVNEMDYFAPLSSFKPKHEHMKNGLDFIKLQKYAVVNLNNMFPVPSGSYSLLNFNTVEDTKYRALLFAEYRYVKNIQKTICTKANTLYKYKIANGNKTALAKRCNDFILLEHMCKKYISE